MTLNKNDLNQVPDQRFSLKQWFSAGAHSCRLRKPGSGYCYLRWLNTVSSTCIWMGRHNHSLSLDATIMVSKNGSIIGEHVVIIFFDIFGYHSNSMTLKTPLITALGAYNSKTAR